MRVRHAGVAIVGLLAATSVARAQAIPTPVGLAQHAPAADTATPALTWVAPRHSPSYGRYALIGIGAGAVTGLVVGIVARRNSTDCNDCMFFNADAIVPLSVAAGAVAGFAVGNVAYLVARANARASRERGTTQSGTLDNNSAHLSSRNRHPEFSAP